MFHIPMNTVLRGQGQSAGGGSPPDSPTLTIAVDGTSVTFTIAGATAGTTNSIYKRTGSGDWETSPTTTIAGNGSSTETVAAGAYYGRVVSEDGSGQQAAGATDPVPFNVIDTSAAIVRSDFGDMFNDEMEETMLEEFGESVTYRRNASSVVVEAVLEKVDSQYDPSTGVQISIGDSAWTIRVDDLDFGAGIVEPALGDKIVTATGHEYDVLEPGEMDSERVFRKIPVRRVEF